MCAPKQVAILHRFKFLCQFASEKVVNGRKQVRWGRIWSIKISMAPVGFEPTTNGLCLPLRLSPRSKSSLWSGLSLHFTCLPFSLYTFLMFPTRNTGLVRLGSGLPSHFRD